MIKYDKIIKALEQKQNRTPKEESGLMELKRLEGIIKEISEKMESLSAKPTDKVSDERRSLALEISKYSRMEKSILRNLGLVEQPRRAVYTPLTKEEIEEQRKMQEEEIKRRKEEEQRRMLEKEFEDWKRKFYIFKPCDWREIVMTIVGVFLGIGGVSLLAYVTDQPFIMAPFGASAVLLYCASSFPLAQPRNFLCSHFIAGVIGITCVNLLGSSWYVAAISVCLAIIAMMLTDTVHPPGGATALLVVLQDTRSYLFLLRPILVGVVIMFVAAIISARLFPGVRPYPKESK